MLPVQQRLDVGNRAGAADIAKFLSFKIIAVTTTDYILAKIKFQTLEEESKNQTQPIENT